MFALIVVLLLNDGGQERQFPMRHNAAFLTLSECMEAAAEAASQIEQEPSVIAMQAVCVPQPGEDERDA